jgi:hypothetical protein
MLPFVITLPILSANYNQMLNIQLAIIAVEPETVILWEVTACLSNKKSDQWKTGDFHP